MKGMPPFNFENPYEWNNYKITVKPLCLSPIDKPDMSPFLVHMTGKDAILSILKSGEGLGEGKINAQVPESSKSKWYEKKVVCFTETVLHAIDSFRYISLSRHQANLFYGIGFSKEKLAIRKDVKPALYMDTRLIGMLAQLDTNYNKSIDEYDDNDRQIKGLLNSIIPYITPAFQSAQKQGFTWEREWRYFGDDGFEFNYSEIKIICCPENEKKDIQIALGNYANSIKFVSTWGEYNEVVEFMKSREHNFTLGIGQGETINNLLEKKTELNRAKNQLQAYQDYAKKLAAQISTLENYVESYSTTIQAIDEKVLKLENEKNKSYITYGVCNKCGEEPNEPLIGYSPIDDDMAMDGYCKVCVKIVWAEDNLRNNDKFEF